jgi:gas vesicle protein
MSTGRFFTGFLVGSAIGGILGILLAPASGEQTRDKIIDKADDAYKNAENSVREIQAKANDVIDDIQKKGDELLNKVYDLLKKNQ